MGEIKYAKQFIKSKVHMDNVLIEITYEDGERSYQMNFDEELFDIAEYKYLWLYIMIPVFGGRGYISQICDDMGKDLNDYGDNLKNWYHDYFMVLSSMIFTMYNNPIISPDAIQKYKEQCFRNIRLLIFIAKKKNILCIDVISLIRDFIYK